MKKIGFITYKEELDLTQSDSLVQKSLLTKGYQSDVLAWDDEFVEWSNYNILILRSCCSMQDLMLLLKMMNC